MLFIKNREKGLFKYGVVLVSRVHKTLKNIFCHSLQKARDRTRRIRLMLHKHATITCVEIVSIY